MILEGCVCVVAIAVVLAVCIHFASERAGHFGRSEQYLGSQPIVLITHKYGDKLNELWKNLHWSHGRKLVICDCDVDTVKRFDDALVKILVNRRDTQRRLRHSLDQPHLEWMAIDTAFLYMCDQHYDHFWLIENDVAFEPSTLQQLLEKYMGDDCDLIGTGPFDRGEDWPWHTTRCRYACELRSGTLMSFCRISKRLCKRVVELASQNKASYIEKLLPSICVKEGWKMRSFDEDDIDAGYSIWPATEQDCERASKPLHACKNLVL